MKRRIWTITVMGAWCGVASLSAQGQEIPENYDPVRPAGIGGAFTSIANDENAVWTNPAGIARIRKARSRSTVNLVRFPNLAAGVNTEAKSFAESVKAGKDALIQKSSQLKESKPFWAMGEAFPMMMLDMSGMPAILGAFTHFTTKAVIDKDNPAQANTQMVWDTGAVFGIAKTNRTNRFNIGIQARAISRGAFEEYVPIVTLADRKEMNKRFTADSNKSTALAVDSGMMWTFADFWFPTIGISVLNMPTSGCKKDYLNPFSERRETECGTVYTGTIVNQDAISTVDPTDIRIGASITPRLSHKLGMRIAVDVHHFHVLSGQDNYGYSNIPVMKTLHAGIEIFEGNPLLRSPFSVSAGFSQGSPTFGAFMNLGYCTLEFASYGRDISSTATPQIDRRYVAGLSFEI